MSSDPLFHKGHRRRLAKKFWDDKITNDELLEFVLGDTILGRDVRIPARALMKRFGNLEQVLAANPDALKQVSGIGIKSVERLKSTHLIMVRAINGILAKTPVYRAQEVMETYCRTKLSQLRREEFHVLYLDKDCKVILDETHSVGTTNYSDVYSNEVLFAAMRLGAHSVCLYHNHPGCTCDFSPDDIRTTKELKYKLNVVNIELYDHLLVAAGTTFSMKNKHIIF